MQRAEALKATIAKLEQEQSKNPELLRQAQGQFDTANNYLQQAKDKFSEFCKNQPLGQLLRDVYNADLRSLGDDIVYTTTQGVHLTIDGKEHNWGIKVSAKEVINLIFGRSASILKLQDVQSDRILPGHRNETLVPGRTFYLAREKVSDGELKCIITKVSIAEIAQEAMAAIVEFVKKTASNTTEALDPEKWDNAKGSDKALVKIYTKYFGDADAVPPALPITPLGDIEPQTKTLCDLLDQLEKTQARVNNASEKLRLRQERVEKNPVELAEAQAALAALQENKGKLLQIAAGKARGQGPDLPK